MTNDEMHQNSATETSQFQMLPTGWVGSIGGDLRSVYRSAFERASEIYLANAFLTEWPSDLTLNPRCSIFRLVIGADFGTTRKAAVEASLDWLPVRFRGCILAFNQQGVSFHPKSMLWKEHDGTHHVLIGSSNLTNAAFTRNVEANVTLRLSATEYEHALAWFTEIESRSVEVNERWLDAYEEAPVRAPRRDPENANDVVGTDEDDEEVDAPVFDLALELQTAEERRDFSEFLAQRRQQRATFDAQVKRDLTTLIYASAARSTWTDENNLEFYDELIRLWGKDHTTRMGGMQWVIRGKHANHQELARSLAAVLNARANERDAVVQTEKDRLSVAGVSTRRALFTELLCHLFPTKYPILDGPVRRWRSEVGFDERIGGTEGERYLRLARAMRAALHEAGPQALDIKNLAELDTLIWFKLG